MATPKIKLGHGWEMLVVVTNQNKLMTSQKQEQVSDLKFGKLFHSHKQQALNSNTKVQFKYITFKLMDIRMY